MTGTVNDLYDRVDKALDEIRPYIHSHAGDVNIVDVTDEGVVKLQMVGTCHGCPMSMLTLRLGIERILMREGRGRHERRLHPARRDRLRQPSSPTTTATA